MGVALSLVPPLVSLRTSFEVAALEFIQT